jgi:ribosomal protein L11 methyltransferase
MNEYYYQLIVTPESHLDIFSETLLEIMQNAIEEKNGSLIVRDNEPLDDVAWAIESMGERLGISVHTTLSKEKNEDWINKYKSSIQPIEVGNFYVRPQWENPKENTIDIIINPALAFGSGHHETTYSCLQTINNYVKENDTLLDVGCGSGILSIAAAKMGAKVDICDTDEIAVKSAEDNFTLNNIDFHESWVGSAHNSTNTYDIVVANIIADVLLMIHKDLKKSVKLGGILILSGIIDKYIDKVKDKYQDFELLENLQNKEWHTLIFKRI